MDLKTFFDELELEFHNKEMERKYPITDEQKKEVEKLVDELYEEMKKK